MSTSTIGRPNCSETTPLQGAIEIVEQDGVPVLRLCGEIDSLVVSAWESLTTSAPAAVAVDVAEATFLDCRGLRLMLRATEQTRRSGVLPELRHPARAVRRVVDLSGAAPLFDTVA